MELDEELVGVNALTFVDEDLVDAAIGGRAELVIHLHRLHDDEDVPLLDGVAGGAAHFDDGAGHRRGEARLALRAAGVMGALAGRAPRSDVVVEGVAADGDDGATAAAFEIELGRPVVDHEEVETGVADAFELAVAPVFGAFAADERTVAFVLNFEAYVVIADAN
jgi:hypothetical protein